MNDNERAKYAFKHRELAPYQRREKAYRQMNQALALLQDEVDIQAAYNQMDYHALPMGHYKWACKLLKTAIESLEREQDENTWKILHKEGV